MVEIDDEEVGKTDVVRALGGKYNAEILSVTQEPRSAKELNEEFDVPIATGYRRIEELTDVGLIDFEESILTDERRRRDTYRRRVDSITVTFEEDDFSVSVEEHAPVENKLDDMWRTLSDSDSDRSSGL